MSNRKRSRSKKTSDPASQDAYEAGRTTLDLNDVSEEELEALHFNDDASEKNGFLSLSTLTGLGLILVGTVYLLSEIGVWSGPLLSDLGAALPLLIGVMVILLGFGMLTWPRSSTSSGGGTRTKAVDAETGETKVVEEPETTAKSRLTRSRTDKKLMGVCGGIAAYLNLDPTLVRIVFVVGVIASGGPFILAYIGLAFAIPKEPSSSAEQMSVIHNDTGTE